MKYLSGKLSDKKHQKLRMQLLVDGLSFQEWLEKQINDYIDWEEPEPEKEQEFLTTREVADIVGCTQKTIQNYINQGKINAETIKGVYKLPAGEVEEVKKLYGKRN